MDRGTLELGSADGLWFRVRWLGDRDSQDAEIATDGLVAAGIGDDAVWSGAGQGIRWSWADLLVHLSTHWRRLLIEEMDPLGLAEPDPSKLRAAAEGRWEALPAERGDEEDDTLCRFELAHDLAAGLPGIDAPPFWFLRQGAEVVIGHPNRLRKLGFRDALAALETFGQGIAERLTNAVGERARSARDQWQARSDQFDRDALRLATWQTDAVIDELLAECQPGELFKMVDGVPEMAPVLAAARMVGDALSPSMIREVISRLSAYPFRPTRDLDGLARRAEETFEENMFERDYEFGHSLAHWIREQSNIVDPSGRAQPEHMLTGWNVAIEAIELPAPQIDAIAAWGMNTGPVIMVNRLGKRARFPTGRRAVLAHELCHLLIDRRRALPAADVLGGRVSQPAERRANAFAAELLLPRDRAGREAAHAENIESAIRSLSQRFGVSFELAAWQVRNSNVNLSAEDISSLKRWVRDLVAL